MEPRALPRLDRNSSAPFAIIVPAFENLFSTIASIASRSVPTSASAACTSAASPKRSTSAYRNMMIGRALEYGTITTPRMNASVWARDNTWYAASGTAATATGAVTDVSMYCPTSFARAATAFSTFRAQASRRVGSSSASIASSSATAAHLESIGRRRPSGRRRPNSTTLPFTRKSDASIDGGSWPRCSRRTCSPARPFVFPPARTVASLPDHLPVLRLGGAALLVPHLELLQGVPRGLEAGPEVLGGDVALAGGVGDPAELGRLDLQPRGQLGVELGVQGVLGR